MHTDPQSAADVTHPGGMNASRVLPTAARDHLDPFVVFERFYIAPDQGFETHPHRGFEIVSYMLEGRMAHDDSLGNEDVVGPGDAMRVTTGSGIRHSEMPAGGACNGLQLWVNLPRELKGTDPGYGDVSANDLPTTETAGATVTTVVGEGSPVDLHTPVEYRDARIDGEWTWTVPDGWNGFCYGVAGSGTAAGEPMTAGEFVVVEGGEAVPLATDGSFRVAAIAGRPHDEPIRQRGPFVE
jgi:redox-sensitive bicupin YhaK (pirin superfamily)